jgi:hypothetical protein
MELEEKARQLRAQMLAHRGRRLTHRGRRLKGQAEGPLRRRFLELDAKIRRLYATPGVKERFEVACMAYNEATRRLEHVEGSVNGGEPAPGMWSFWLPFGLGLSGSCFKEGDSVFFFKRPKDAAHAEHAYYLYLPDRPPPPVLIAVPLLHPGYEDSGSIEPSRQCIGVVNIQSNHEATKLLDLFGSKEKIDELWFLCQEFCEQISRDLGGRRAGSAVVK